MHYASYQIVAMVLHQGAGHENGHYQSILAIDDAYWLSDKESYPTPIPHLTTQKQEISHVWMVLSTTDELVPDTAIEVAESLRKKPKKALEVLTITFSNVTFFGKKVQDWVSRRFHHALPRGPFAKRGAGQHHAVLHHKRMQLATGDPLEGSSLSIQHGTSSTMSLTTPNKAMAGQRCACSAKGRISTSSRSTFELEKRCSHH